MKYENERTRPCRDLVQRVALSGVRRAVDLGCGPGNSTRVLSERWPSAEILGLDSSPEMIARAREEQPEARWLVGDLVEWTAQPGEPWDLVFSNATLQWVPDHRVVLPRLLARSRGALAVQMPYNIEGPAQLLMREMASSSAWEPRLSGLRATHVEDIGFYYDLLQPLASSLELWSTEYVHVMPDAEAIVDWYKGTGLRPYLDALSDAGDRARFLAEYLEGLRAIYLPRPDGRVLFPFRRLFLVAYAGKGSTADSPA